MVAKHCKAEVKERIIIIIKSFVYEFHRFFFVILVYLFIIIWGCLGIAQATLLPYFANLQNMF